MKSNLLKSSLLFVAMLIMTMAVTFTAYAAENDTESASGYEGQQLGNSTYTVYQAGENESLEEILGGILDGTQESSLSQGGYNIIIVLPAIGQEAIADLVTAAAEMSIPLTNSTPEPPAPRIERASAIQTADIVSPDETAQPLYEVEITTRAESSANPLQGTGFTVYRAVENQPVGEVTTDADGEATISLPQGEYYLRNDSVQYGYLCERSRIFFTVGTGGRVTVEVTIQRDADIPDADLEIIAVPKTGELPPVMNYLLGMICMAVALLCGISLSRQRKRNQYKRRGALAYA